MNSEDHNNNQASPIKEDVSYKCNKNLNFLELLGDECW